MQVDVLAKSEAEFLVDFEEGIDDRRGDVTVEQRLVGARAAISSTPLTAVSSCSCRWVFPLPSRFRRPFIPVSSGWQDSSTQAQRCHRARRDRPSVALDVRDNRTGKRQLHLVLPPHNLPVEHLLNLVNNLLTNARLVDLPEQVREH